MKKGISVILCTYNGSSRLPKTIEHLARQTVDRPISWEVIVVDNASTDQSAQVAKEEWARYPLGLPDFSVLYEKRPGKIYALEQAISRAKFEYCIICDDDNWLRSDYVVKMFELLEGRPDVGAAGGQGIAVAESGVLPDWFTEFQEGYAVGKQGQQSGDITSKGYLWGAGMGTRTRLYKEMYSNFPSLLTGRLGEQLSAGEDAEYCIRLILKGYKLYYDADLVFQHYMPNIRLTPEYRVRLFEGFTKSGEVLSKYHFVNSVRLKCSRNKLTPLRLFLIAPFRIFFAKEGPQKEKERDILAFISPFKRKPNSIIAKIKRFCIDIKN